MYRISITLWSGRTTVNWNIIIGKNQQLSARERYTVVTMEHLTGWYGNAGHSTGQSSKVVVLKLSSARRHNYPLLYDIILLLTPLQKILECCNRRRFLVVVYFDDSSLLDMQSKIIWSKNTVSRLAAFNTNLISIFIGRRVSFGYTVFGNKIPLTALSKRGTIIFCLITQCFIHTTTINSLPWFTLHFVATVFQRLETRCLVSN